MFIGQYEGGERASQERAWRHARGAFDKGQFEDGKMPALARLVRCLYFVQLPS